MCLAIELCEYRTSILTVLFPYVNNKAVSIFSSCLTMTLFDWTHDVLYSRVNFHSLSGPVEDTLIQWHLLVTARGWLAVVGHLFMQQSSLICTHCWQLH